ncbi:5145_t:CDS:2 [Entrophospora sp. SA101]|nr:5145_t:CDS:2 [Entrophospora sp. SA101]
MPTLETGWNHQIRDQGWIEWKDQGILDEIVELLFKHISFLERTIAAVTPSLTSLDDNDISSIIVDRKDKSYAEKLLS